MRKRIDESFNNLLDREIYIVNKAPKTLNTLKKTLIANVDVNNLNSIVKQIIKANSNIEVDKIYYIESFQQLIFLADDELDISVYTAMLKNSCKKSGKNSFAKYLIQAFEDLDEIKVGEVSLAEIKEIYIAKSSEFMEIKQKLKEELDLKLIAKTNYRFSSILNFNYNTNTLYLMFDRKYKLNVRFNDGKIEFFDNDEKFLYLSSVLWDIYDMYKKYESFNVSEIKNLASTNTKFFINFDMFGFEFFLTDIQNSELLKITFNVFENDLQIFMINNNNSRQFIEDNYQDFLNYIYVAIDKLPVWLQKELLKKRQKELNLKSNAVSGVLSLVRKIKDYFK